MSGRGRECPRFKLAADVKNSKLATACPRAVHPFKARAGRKEKRGKVVNSQLSLASLFTVVVCVVSLPAIIQIEGREERGGTGLLAIHGY